MGTINAPALASAKETERQLGLITQPSPELDKSKASAAMTVAHIETIQDPVKNVQFYGAKADGTTLNNAAFAKAVATGEVIFDQPGVYLLDGVNAPFDINKAGCKLRVTVSGVILQIRPNNQSRSYVVRVTGTDCDCDFRDAVIRGDRDKHSWTPDPDGKWHEHGYGLWVSGARNKVRGLIDEQNPFGACRITNCTGDGIGVAKAGHDISGFVSTGNRRQGCSAFDCANTDIHHNTFEVTGPLPGVPDPLGLPGPFAGLDVEPDKGNVTGLRIFNNLFKSNRGSGITIWVRKAVLTRIEVDIFDNTFIGNVNNLWAKDEAQRAHTIRINLWRNNSANAKNHDFRIDQGTIAQIGTLDRANANIFDDLNPRDDRWRQGVVNPEIGKYANAQVNADGWNQYV